MAKPVKKRECRVTLECGCAVLLYDNPRNDHVRYPCPSNMGHGYSQRWTSWIWPGFGDRTNTSEPSRRYKAAQRLVSESEPVGFTDVKVGDRLSFGTHSSAVRRAVWREGVVTSVSAKSVYVWVADGTQSRLDRDRWAQRGVGRLA